MNIPGIALRDFIDKLPQYHQLRLRLNHQPSSVLSAQRDLDLLCRYCRQEQASTVTGPTVITFFSWLKDHRNNNSGAINRKRASICSYVRYLRANQVPGANDFPLEFLPRARQPYAGPVKTLEPDQTQRLLNSIDRSSVLGYRDFTLFSLQYALGLRLGEALRIDIADIDHDKKLLHIHGKGRKERTLPLAEPVANMLSQWIKHRKALLNSDTSNALFLSKKGNRLSLRTAEDNFANIVNKAGPFDIPRVVPHTLRHCFASHALETEKDLVVVKAMLGHSLMRSTEIYLHPSLRLMRKCADTHVAAETVSEARSHRKWIRGIQNRKTA
jgi:site-specific recombinase XerD